MFEKLKKMKWQDAVNASFELLGGCVIWLSIVAVIQAMEVKGIDWRHIAFFSLWGIWNMYYYRHLNQFASFLAGLWITISNTIWVGLIIYYMYFNG